MACTACSTNPYNPMMAPGLSPMGGAFNPGFNPVGRPGMDNSMVGANTMMLMAMTELLMILMSMMNSQGMAGQAQNFAPAADAMAPLGSAAAPSGAAAPAESAAPAAPASGPVGGSETGQKLAQSAEATANRMGSVGWCYKGVGESLRSIGVETSGASAYMAADQLAKNPKMREVQVSNEELPKLPAGAVVVWDHNAEHQHGHISIALGNGKEASDHVQDQITNFGTSHRVFIPV